MRLAFADMLASISFRDRFFDRLDLSPPTFFIATEEMEDADEMDTVSSSLRSSARLRFATTTEDD